LSEQKGALEPSSLFDELAAWDIDSARATIEQWAGKPPKAEAVGDGLRIGTLARVETEDPDTLDAAARLLAATYLTIEDTFRVPYFELQG
jgi:hypothetical protein